MDKLKKKKVLILAERFYPEEFLINSLAESWELHDYEFEVLTQEPSYPFGHVSHFDGYKNPIYNKTFWNTIIIHRIYTVQGYKKSKFLKFLNYLNFAILGTICLLVLGKKYHTVFIYQTGPLTMALPATLLRKIFNFKVVIWTQDLWPDGVYEYGVKKRWYISILLNFIVKSVYSNCDTILVSCKGFIEKISAYTQKEIHFIPQWSNFNFDDIPIDSTNLLESDKFHFTFAGNLSRHQNIENVILGFHLFAQNNQNIILNIIGDGYHLSRVKEIVIENKIKNIVFWGRKPIKMIPNYLSQSDGLVISLLGTPLLELFIPSKFPSYLPFGKPIVCLMNGAVKEIVENAGIGITGDPNDLNSIKDAFGKIHDLPEHDRLRMAENSTKLSRTMFDKYELIQKMNNFVFTPKISYHEAIGS